MAVGLAEVLAARDRIRELVHRTPVETCVTINARADARVYFKCENLQRVGAFKFRGATNAVQLLPDAVAERGVVTHSSGNHAAALALAASQRGIPAYIVMPRTAPQIKKDAVAGYGGEITECEPTQAAREATASAIMDRTGATLVHPYDDEAVIAGQGTAALELLDEVPDLDAILTPVGGGGLLSGTAIAAKGLRPTIQVFGCEPAQAGDAAESIRQGRVVPAFPPNTIADGLLTSLGQITFPIIRDRVDAIALVEESEIVDALQLVLERMKLVIEPSSAVPLAALLMGNMGLRGKKVGIVLSGGNLDVSRTISALRRG